jgi:alpha-2-macroglobulin
MTLSCSAASIFLRRSLQAPKNLKDYELNQQAFILYALAEAKVSEPNRAGALFDERERLDKFGKAYLALALELINDTAAAARIETLLSDLAGSAIVTSTSAHWEEGWVDLWNMNTDTRTTSIVILALARLNPEQPLAPNAVRWLMSARTADRWETTQENAWAIMGLTEWMAATGELEGNYDWQVRVNGDELGKGTVTPSTVQNVTALRADIKELLLDQTNGVVISRTTGAGETGKGQLYYTAHLKTYQPVEKIEPVNRGFAVSRQYRLADCGQTEENEECPLVDQAQVGDIIAVKVTLVVPHVSHYVIVEDPLPAGTEAVDTGLRTTSQAVEGPDSRSRVRARTVTAGGGLPPTSSCGTRRR